MLLEPRKTYPKIDTLYTRDEKFNLTRQIRRPEFASINKWILTEKIDGMNVRVCLELDTIKSQGGGNQREEWVVNFYGKSDKAKLPMNLQFKLTELFPIKVLQELWLPKKDPETKAMIDQQYPITLFGEGYGQKIQKGGSQYFHEDAEGLDGVGFILFDVLVGNESWLEWDQVCDIAEKLDIPRVTSAIIDIDQLDDIVTAVEYSTVSEQSLINDSKRESEGVVARSIPALFNARGQRVMWKLKTSDYVEKK